MENSGRERPAPPSIQPAGKDDAILITGAGGFIGRNLCVRLAAMGYTKLLAYDVDSPEGALEEYVREAKFVFHLAGVNRPKDPDEFYQGNAGLTQQLISLLEATGSEAPLVLSSSAQAGNGTDYARSKEQAEEAAFVHGDRNGGRVFVYRLPNVFGKWSRPAYNSVVATFCHNIARDERIEIRDPEFPLPLCYIDDVVDSFVAILEGRAQPGPRGLFFSIGPVYRVTLGDLAAMLYAFKQSRDNLYLPDMKIDFQRKLYATYLSYLPEDAFAFGVKSNADERGSFSELLRSPECGQISVNVTKPGYTKGNHWHDTKNEKFMVVSGEGLIRFRRLGTGKVIDYPVSAAELCWVDIPPGYTHSIENVGQSDLVTLMWANQPYDEKRPDTWREEV